MAHFSHWANTLNEDNEVKIEEISQIPQQCTPHSIALQPPITTPSS